jgi:glutamate--cysteine ligase
VISRRLNLLKLSCNGRSLFVKGTSFPVNPQPACLIANNKFLTKKVLRSHNILVPKSCLARTPLEARKIVLRKDLFPCVLKPSRGAHGRKVFANIESLKEFDEILPLIFNGQSKKSVLVEEFINGKDYRLFVVGSRVSAVLERTPAHIIGDGISNISQLISEFNRSPLVGKKYEKPLCKIIFDEEVKRNLRKQNKKLTYIPKEGEKVFLRQNVNISAGGTGRDVTDNVDQKIKELAVKAAKAIGMVITGVDIIYDKQSRKAYVLELNDVPGIDVHHHPYMGRSQDVANDIVECLFERLGGEKYEKQAFHEKFRPKATKKQLMELFSQAGKAKKANIVTDK